MAGVTTAARAGWGIIASSEAMNPTVGSGSDMSYSPGVGGNFYISNIPTNRWKDLEIWIHINQSSTWAGEGYFAFGNSATPNRGCYNYWGWSTGQSQGGNSQANQYVYPQSYSNMAGCLHIYLANAFTNQNTKAWYYEAYNSSGNQTSYATVQAGAGVYETSTPVDQMYIYTPWGNGSSSYQGWQIIGRNPQ